MLRMTIGGGLLLTDIILSSLSVSSHEAPTAIWGALVLTLVSAWPTINRWADALLAGHSNPVESEA